MHTYTIRVIRFIKYLQRKANYAKYTLKVVCSIKYFVLDINVL